MSRLFVFIISLLLVWGCSCTKNPTAQETAALAASSQAAGETDGATPQAPDPTIKVATPNFKKAIIPVDPEVRIRKLDNGLTYFIRKNAKPENRVELRLAVNAGSILEDEDQQGLAHFLEHMAFNGTENFKKQELVDYLLGIGMRFGADINAYTSFDETVYMLEVPTEDPEILEKAFQIMEDWAHLVLNEQEEVEKERGVVLEEWRIGRGASGRLREKQWPRLFKDSRYAERIPIGKEDIIKSANRDTLHRFYKDWYRPDLMAVVAVGDMDPDKIEELIEKHFGGIPKPVNPKPRPSYDVPDHDETLFSIATDPEQTTSSVSITYKHPVRSHDHESDFRRSLVESLFQSMINQRLRERSQEANPPFIFGFTSRGSFVRTKDFVTQSATVKEGGFEEGLAALLGEAERARKFGFTATELEREKKSQLRSMEQAYQERDKRQSSGFARDYLQYFLDGEIIPGISWTYEAYQRFLPGITLDEVNKAADHWFTEKNRVILVSAPEKEGLAVPTSEQLLAYIENAAKMDVKPYQDEVSDEPLLAQLPAPGQIVEKTYHEALDLYIWRLSNSARVIVKSTDFQNEEILFASFSPGGSSLVDDAAYIPAATATSLITSSGLGNFDEIAFQKMMSDKIARVTPYISSLEEGMRGRAAPQDLETMFQQVYLYFNQPRLDEKAFGSYKTRMKAFIENNRSRPETVFFEEFNKVYYKDHPRTQPITLETLDKMDMAASLQIYKERFANAGDFVFLLVGNLDLAKLEPLVETYLASLPALQRLDTWRDLGIDTVDGIQKVEVHKGVEPKSTAVINFSGMAEWNTDNRYALQSLIEVLRIRLREVLREDKGGVYGVSVGGELERFPKQTYETRISFTCAPENAQDLMASALAELESIRKDGIDKSYIDKVKEIQLRGYETGVKRNNFWLSNLTFYYRNELDLEGITSYPERVATLTVEMVREAAIKYFDPNRYVLGYLFPEDKK